LFKQFITGGGQQRKTLLRRYGFAVFVSGLGLAFKVLIHGVNADLIPFFFLAMTLSSVYGGKGPGILTAAICSLVNLYFCIPPENSFYIDSLENAIQFAEFTMGALLISSLTGALYEERERAKVAAEKALDYVQQKESFVANVTHEIRTPINAVIGLSQIINEIEGVPRDVKGYIVQIQESSEALLALVNDILDFAKLDFGKIDIESIDFKIVEKIQRCVNLIGQAARNKNLDLICKIDSRLPIFLKGDPSRISQILLNLLSNAVKFTLKGQIQLNVEVLKQLDGVWFVKFGVTDTGIGIAKEAHEKIFDTFVQEDISTTRKFGGTGLGLSICKRLVGLMGGEMGLSSQVGKGSTFWFSLPMKIGDQRLAEEYSTEQQGKTKSVKTSLDKKILVVEDNKTNLLIATKLLERLGCQVDSASDGREALDLLKKQKYDAIIMDCHMPNMDGYITTQKIREIENLSHLHTPIIALTAYASVENEEKCTRAGMDGYLTKPLRSDQLIMALGKWIRFESQSDPVTGSLFRTFETVDRTFDVRYLLTLRKQLEGDGDIVVELIDTFVDHTPSRIQELENAGEKKNAVDLEKISHNLKSASVTVGALNMARLCDLLEVLSTKNQLIAAEAAIGALKCEFFTVKERLVSFKKEIYCAS